LTYGEAISHIQKIIIERMKKFPYVFLNDRYILMDEEFLGGLNALVVIYKGEKDYVETRLKIDSAKIFELDRPVVFISQHRSADDYFHDVLDWFEHIDIAEKALEFLSEMIGQEIPQTMSPLGVLILKRAIIDRLNDYCKKIEIEKSFLTEPFWKDFLISVVVDEDIFSVRDREGKIAKIFRVIFNPTKYLETKGLLNLEEIGAFIEDVFSVDETAKRCLADENFRKITCIIVFGIYCMENLPRDKKETLTLLLFARFGIGEEQRDKMRGFYEIIKAELSSLCQLNLEKDVLESVNSFAKDKDNAIIWFDGISLKEASKVLSTYLPAEIDWVSQKVEQLIKTLPTDTRMIESIVENLQGWFVSSTDDARKKIDRLRLEVHLLKALNSFPKTPAESYADWFVVDKNPYESVILSGDYYLSMEDPGLLESEAWQAVSKRYKETRNQFLEKYESMFSKDYPDWIEGSKHGPKMVNDVVNYVKAHIIDNYETIFLIIVDGMRLDFWHILRQNLNDADFEIVHEERMSSIIPSATPFARRAIFRGKFPEDFEDDKVDDKVALQRALNLKSPITLKEVKVTDLLELTTGKVRVFIYYTAEFLHKYPQGIAYALQSFEKAVPDFVGYLKQTVKKARKPVVIIVSDHGATEISEKELIPIRIPEYLKKRLYKISEFRFWILGGKGIRDYERETFRNQVRKDFGSNVFIFSPEELKLKSDRIRCRNKTVLWPFLVVLPRKFGSLSREIARLYAHGGLTPYETIVPFAVLVPK